jgi:hypothetical protein
VIISSNRPSFRGGRNSHSCGVRAKGGVTTLVWVDCTPEDSIKISMHVLCAEERLSGLTTALSEVQGSIVSDDQLPLK